MNAKQKRIRRQDRIGCAIIIGSAILFVLGMYANLQLLNAYWGV